MDLGPGRYIQSLPFPRYYLDFETIQFAVPIWVGTSPYQQLPFEWSCHIEEAGREIGHRFFLDTSGDPPIRKLAENLIESLGDRGPILVYSQFEKSALNLLTKLFPDLSTGTDALIDRLVDLLPLTRKWVLPSGDEGLQVNKSSPSHCGSHLDYGTFEDVSDGQAAQFRGHNSQFRGHILNCAFRPALAPVLPRGVCGQTPLQSSNKFVALQGSPGALMPSQ